jgi:MSHA biogenesis protein MshN
MSVVNKMLRDLEARKSRDEEVDANYHPPQNKHTKSLISVALLLGIVMIAFAFMYGDLLYEENKTSKNTADSVTNRMVVIPQEKRQVPLQLQAASTQMTTTEIAPKPMVVTNNIGLPNNLPDKKHILLNAPRGTLDKSVSIQSIKVKKQDKQSESESVSVSEDQTPTEQISSFSMSGVGQENNTSHLRQRIFDSLNNDNFDLAQSLLSDLLAIDPNNIKTRKKLASLLFAQGNYIQSEQLLAQGIKLHPAQSDLRLMLARLYMAQKKSAQAIDILAKFQPSTANQVEYLAYRASLAQQLKQTQLAMSDYLVLTKIEPGNARWWLGLAVIRDQLGERKIALQAYNKANELGQLDGSVNDFIQQRISVLTGVP